MTEEEKDCDLLRFAKEELNIIRNSIPETDEEGIRMQDQFNECLIKMIEVFCGFGHSGASAEIAIDMLYHLLKYQPLSPLTLEDNEWMEVSDGVYQNKRAYNVFKEANRFEGKPYCIDGPNGQIVTLEEYPLSYVGILLTKEEIDKERAEREQAGE